MFQTNATAAVSLGCLISAAAQAPVPAAPMAPMFDAARVSFNHAAGMDFVNESGKLDASSFELRSLLSKPIPVFQDLIVIPIFEYEATHLNFSDTAVGFPMKDELLHSVNLSAFALSMSSTTPWVYGGWARAEMATDFQHVGSDDFTFDVVGGVGYRFSNRFTLAVGAAVINLNGDAAVYPGISFDWRASNTLRVGLYGPSLVAAYTPDADWELSFRGENGGGTWNITDVGGRSKSIDLTSYRVGLFASRRLTGDLWLTAGGGATVGNEISLADPDGDNNDDAEMKSGVFGQLGLSLNVW